MTDEARRAAFFRFYGSLRDFLAAGFGTRPLSPIRYRFWGRPAVKDAIEAQGVPHPEIDLILIDGDPVSFSHALKDGSRVSVYPWIDSLPRPERALRPPLPDPRRFICDVHLGQLSRHLRMLGFDTFYEKDARDARLARLSAEGNRILLTRDLGLLKRGRVGLGYFVRRDDPRDQLAEVANRLRLPDRIDPFSRCLSCNVELTDAPGRAIDEHVPPRAREAYDEYRQCPSCESVYWPGTHVERMQELVDSIRHASNDSSTSDD